MPLMLQSLQCGLDLLQRAFDRLSEYVHPNYGSHVLCVRPHSVEAAKVFVEAFVTIYEAFLTLPWANDTDDGSEDPNHRGQADLQDPYLILADETVPTLKPVSPAIGEKAWNDAVDCFRHRATCESNWALQDLATDVEAIRALRANAVPPDSWPESVRTVAGQARYVFLVAQEQRLAQDAARLAFGSAQPDDKKRLSVLLSGLSFAINITEHKLDSLARQAARLINDENVLGATLAVRSMLEHHAVAIELGEKLQTIWERAEKIAPNADQIGSAFAEAEKQIARVLAGSSESPEGSSTWRTLWQETVRKPYNVLGPVKALDEKSPGFLKTYGLLSHIAHGTVGTGGDLLGMGGAGWRSGHRPLAAELTLFLADLCRFDAMLDRQAASMTVAHRVDVVHRTASAPAERIKQMRLLEGQKLKPRRDIFGSGTRDDPFRFREGLLYEAIGVVNGFDTSDLRTKEKHGSRACKWFHKSLPAMTCEMATSGVSCQLRRARRKCEMFAERCRGPVEQAARLLLHRDRRKTSETLVLRCCGSRDQG